MRYRPGSGPARWRLVGAENYVALCDLGIFVDQTAKSVSPQDADSRRFCWWIGSPSGRILVQRSVWPVGVVVVGVLAQDEPQMPFTDDQQLI